MNTDELSMDHAAIVEEVRSAKRQGRPCAFNTLPGDGLESFIETYGQTHQLTRSLLEATFKHLNGLEQLTTTQKTLRRQLEATLKQGTKKSTTSATATHSAVQTGTHKPVKSTTQIADLDTEGMQDDEVKIIEEAKQEKPDFTKIAGGSVVDFIIKYSGRCSFSRPFLRVAHEHLKVQPTTYLSPEKITLRTRLAKEFDTQVLP